MDTNRRKAETPLKLAFITPHYPPSSGFGGVTEASYRLSHALAERGVHVSVLTSDAALNGRVAPERFKEEERDNLKIYPYRYCKGRKSAPSLSGHRIISNVVKECDIVYLNGIYAYPVTVGAWAAQRWKKPYIVALRNGLDPFMFQIRRTKKKIGFLSYVHPILKKAAVIHATAQQEVNHAQAFGVNGDFVVIPNGIDTITTDGAGVCEAAAEWPVLQGKRVVLFLSRLSPQKGLDMLIPAWASIHKQFHDAILVIAGPDYQGHAAEVRQLITTHAVSESVLFTGEVRDERKRALYHSAHLFVLPSHSENFGNVIAEALAFQLPVLTTTATPWAAINDYNCGLCVEPTDADIRQALESLLAKSTTELQQMGENATRLLRGMNTWQDSAQQFIEVYKRLMNR